MVDSIFMKLESNRFESFSIDSWSLKIILVLLLTIYHFYLGSLLNKFKLEQTSVHNAINLHHELPKGHRRIPGGPAIPGCKDERIYSIAAALSHYKIEFPLDSLPKLKTYVNATSETFYI